jgi:hypothetical protein
MATRAIHLEVAFGLDTDSFLNALARFTSRQGTPTKITSDNGTNFVGAVNELKELVEQLDKDKIQRATSHRNIKWVFNPPGAPHFGGVFEVMVKAAKKALYAVLGNSDITDEELITACAGAESLINSRPITYQTADPQDDVPLTPNHFLHGQVGGVCPRERRCSIVQPSKTVAKGAGVDIKSLVKVVNGILAHVEH